MKRTIIGGAVALTLGLTAFGSALVSSHSAFANQGAKVVKTVKSAGTDYYAKKGVIYANTKLNKVIHKAKNYPRTVFFSNRLAIIKKANGHQGGYRYIISRNGKVHGWIWQGNLKKKSNSTAAKSTATPTGNQTPTTTDSSSSSSSSSSAATSTSSTSTTTAGSTATGSSATSKQNDPSSFSLSDYRAAFLKYLNQERTKRNLAPYTESSSLDALAQKRATQIVTNFSHYDADGNPLGEQLAPQFGVENYGAECLAQNIWDDDSTSDSVAKNDVHEYIYDDADSNWGHRDILLNTQLTAIGMGAVLHEHADGFMATWTAADFSY
ncbi:CAP domain-containing protein [Lentilactobacillus farraginis]|uniref:Transporter n=1 Tax=Lentilactobacillus farraginis DSM 18382 = JCM 14108 TaxID=1423743 RepID=X0QFK0_9LACO|nr:CAP domain-containing protein [Lentilactobacillus farraginis]KRM08195.1 hypothetical protein FD41_GL000267 [Lentilactobacillus farraginis DSM 18382 = JCM 14108]GAF37400.1 transporter [Lentilactobacillus farraginis DSM 18382 = JCM 14108]